LIFLCDVDIKHKRDHVEVYHKKTNIRLFTADNEVEAIEELNKESEGSSYGYDNESRRWHNQARCT
jgi:hypothetical protein